MLQAPRSVALNTTQAAADAQNQVDSTQDPIERQHVTSLMDSIRADQQYAQEVLDRLAAATAHDAGPASTAPHTPCSTHAPGSVVDLSGYVRVRALDVPPLGQGVGGRAEGGGQSHEAEAEAPPDG